MSTPERVSRMPEQDDESSTRKEASLSTSHFPSTHRRVKRFEIGFFIRKIVNGWVTFYKQFPPEHRARVHAQVKGLVPKEPQGDDAPEYGAQRMMAISAPGTGDVAGGGVTTKSETGGGPGDGGPVGSTRYEIGFFATSATTETSDGSSEDDGSK